MHLDFGNRCGHVPADPTLDLTRPIPVGPGGYPRILAVASERLERFYSEPETFPTLALNPSARQKRSERREAVVRLGKSSVKFVDLPSMTVAVRDENLQLQNITVDVLAKHADLEPRRAERALRDLAAAKLVFIVEQRVRLPDGGFRSVPAIKRVSSALFAALGLTVSLDIERRKAQKRLNRATDESKPSAPKPDRRPQHQPDQLSLGFEDAVSFGIREMTASLRNATADHHQRDREPERQRRWNVIALELREQHPDWPAEQIRAAADRAMLS